MKTSIKTLLSVALCALVISSALAAPALATESTKVSRRISVSNFKKINLVGNIDVLLVQNKKSGVIVDEDARNARLKVTQRGETLSIVSDQTERVRVTIYVNDIFRIEAAQNVVVETFNNLDLKYLQIFLHQNAVANISASTESLYTVVGDQARLNLSGSSNHHALVMGRLATLTMKDFKSLKSELSYKDAEVMLSDSIARIK